MFTYYPTFNRSLTLEDDLHRKPSQRPPITLHHSQWQTCSHSASALGLLHTINCPPCPDYRQERDSQHERLQTIKDSHSTKCLALENPTPCKMTQHRCDTLANPWTAHQLSTFTTFATHPAVYLGSSNSIVTVVLILSQRVSPSIILMLQTSSLRAESHAHYLTHNQKLGLRKYKTTPSSTTFTYLNCTIGRKTDHGHLFVDCQKNGLYRSKVVKFMPKV